MIDNFLDVMHFGFEPVDAQLRVSEGRPHAILAESVWMNAQLKQHVEDRGGAETVAFQLHNHQLPHVAAVAGDGIVEGEVCVDGEPFGASLVDQCQSSEAVVQ